MTLLCPLIFTAHQNDSTRNQTALPPRRTHPETHPEKIPPQGVAYTHPDFNCTKPGDPPPCKVAYAQDFTPRTGDDGMDDDPGLRSHGSNVASIALQVRGAASGLSLLAVARLVACFGWRL